MNNKYSTICGYTQEELEEKIKEALRQIKDTKYYEKYLNNNPTLLGIAFGKNKEIASKFENT
jgi:hypothetical protein